MGNLYYPTTYPLILFLLLVDAPPLSPSQSHASTTQSPFIRFSTSTSLRHSITSCFHTIKNINHYQEFAPEWSKNKLTVLHYHFIGIPMNQDTDHSIDYSAEVHLISNPILRALVFLLGIICLVIGIPGVVLPIVPGFPLLLVAAYLFSKSSVRYYNWLMNHKTFGPLIRDYNAGQGIPLRVKLTAVLTLWIAVSISVLYFIPVDYGKIAFIVIAAIVSWHILSLPTKSAG